jgi:hypothetical protein
VKRLDAGVQFPEQRAGFGAERPQAEQSISEPAGCVSFARVNNAAMRPLSRALRRHEAAFPFKR